MVKPYRTSVFLARPISVALWDSAKGTVCFLVALRGKGTAELFEMTAGDKAELTGPLGKSWASSQFPARVALVGGGIGVAPLLGFASELATERDAGSLPYGFDFFAGFRESMPHLERLVAAAGADEVIMTTENGSNRRQGLVTDYFDAAKYAAVYACGPEAMLKAVAAAAKKAHIACFISMERRMACGVGACLGCTVQTIHGNKRCCTDGPVFPADEVIFD
jgi:NAD(P)H-flavin reductase